MGCGGAVNVGLLAEPETVPRSIWERGALLGTLLAGALLAVYGLSLGGGFLNYDDPWLIRDNPVLRDARPAALATIWTDLGERTRMALGAEYLPLRDMSLWIEARVHGLDPRALRVTNLLLYVAAALAMRAYLRRAL